PDPPGGHPPQLVPAQVRGQEESHSCWPRARDRNPATHPISKGSCVMPKSNRPGPFGRGSGTVTVIEEPVLRSYARKATTVFGITWAARARLAAAVRASGSRPMLARSAGGLIALAPAFLAAAVVAAWPVIRAIWWWLPELLLIAGVITGWMELADHTTL